MRRFTTLFVLLLIAALALTACGGAQTAEPAAEPAAATEAPAAPPAASAELFKIAFVLPSPVTDLAWGQSMYDGLMAVQTEMGKDKLEIAFSDNMFQVADAAAAIRDYASEGYDLIIAHGTQYGNSLFDVAKDFPETSFAWGTATDTGADKGLQNVFGIFSIFRGEGL